MPGPAVSGAGGGEEGAGGDGKSWRPSRTHMLGTPSRMGELGLPGNYWAHHSPGQRGNSDQVLRDTLLPRHNLLPSLEQYTR